MDVLEVREAALKALEHIRSGKGPYFLEIITYRFRGHSMGDPERYRKQEEVQCWQEENDPIGIFRNYLLEREASPPMQSWMRLESAPLHESASGGRVCREQPRAGARSAVRAHLRGRGEVR